MDIQDELRVHLKSAILIATAIIASLVIYLGLVEILRAVYRPFRGFATLANIQQLRYAVFGAAAVVIVLIRLLRPRLLRKAPREDAKTALHRLQRAAIVTMVLGEIPGILGLGLFLLSGYNIDFYVLVFASLLLVFMYFPRRTAWEEWLRD
jgi:predicted histidine transporter YuiF (NhaC family)